MAKAKIVTKTGLRITIEGETSEVKEFIEYMETNVKEKTKKSTSVKTHDKKGKLNTATDIILSLKEDDFFNKPKTMLDIKHAIEEQGMIYPMTTLSGVLLKLVRRRELARIKENKKWCYVRR